MIGCDKGDVKFISKMIALHFQSRKNYSFEELDFGIPGNEERYDSPTPPPYRLDSLGVPITIYWGGQDSVASPRNIEKILLELRGDPESPEVRDVLVSHYSHIDFVWGLDAAKVVYPDIIKFFERYL